MKRLLPFVVAALFSVSALAFAQAPAVDGLPPSSSLPGPALATNFDLAPLIAPAPAQENAEHSPRTLSEAAKSVALAPAPVAAPAAAAPAAAEKYVNIPMAGRLGFMLGGRVNPAMSDYGVLGAFKYWVSETFAVKPAFNFNRNSFGADKKISGKSYGVSNVFLFSPWIGKTTRFNLGVGLGFDYSHNMKNGEGGTPTRHDMDNSDDSEFKAPRDAFTLYVPIEAAIEYHIRPWLSWEIGLNMDLFDVLYMPDTEWRGETIDSYKRFGFNLDSTRFYTGITMYTN